MCAKYSTGKAIAICQKSTKQSYKTGKPLKKKQSRPDPNLFLLFI